MNDSSNKLRFVSRATRFLGLGALFLVLFLALQLVSSLVYDRMELRNVATERTLQEWGGRQDVDGMVIRVPCKTGTTQSWVWILPNDLSVEGSFRSEVRNRGIFEVPLYHALLDISGLVRIERDAPWLADVSNIQWDKAEMAFLISYSKAFEINPELTWNGKVIPMEAGGRDNEGNQTALWTRIPDLEPGKDFHFKTQLGFRGGNSFAIFPAGSNTTMKLSSDWPSPSFTGAHLPSTHRLDSDGFEARWSLPRMARGSPSVQIGKSEFPTSNYRDYIRVDFTTPVDTWRLSERSTKYGVLFLFVPFLVFFFGEIFARKRIHPIQYFLAGSSLVVFFLLLLSLSEHLDFTFSFVASSLVVSGLLSWFCTGIYGHWKSGLLWFAGLGVLYSLLYVIINLEDTALLVGSLFVLALLATVMAVARKIDWYSLGTKEVP